MARHNPSFERGRRNSAVPLNFTLYGKPSSGVKKIGDDNYKKELELEVLEYFNPVYEEITNDYLEVIEATERPDFICKRSNGSHVGVEIVQVRRGHQNDIFFDKFINKNINIHPEESLGIISSLVYEKEKKRDSDNWNLPNSTILIVQLQESPLWELADALTEEMFPDLKDYGFCEIWLADFSELEAYNNIELFCLSPSDLRGYYKRPAQKPYG